MLPEIAKPNLVQELEKTRDKMHTQAAQALKGKAELKKEKKRSALLDAAYNLFTTVGFQKTTITDIAWKAGVGKGTFYLYFKDKDDIRAALIMIRSREILTAAVRTLKQREEKMDFADEIVFITDYIITYLSHDIAQLQFISKNLSWSVFLKPEQYGERGQEAEKFHQEIIEQIRQAGVSHISQRDVDTILFTMIELINSTCYHIIMNGEPITLGEYKPYLFRMIRLLVNDAMENGISPEK